MSGDIGKSWKIDTMPPWLMKPCCMLTPSTVASSPDCRPPLMRASNAFAPPPVLTPGISIAKPAEERGPLSKISGNCCSVSGEMPCCCVPVPEHRRAADDLDALLLGADRQGDVHALDRAERDVDVRGATCWNPSFVAGPRTWRREVAKRVFAVRARHRRADDLVGGDVAQRQRDIGDDGA